MLDHLIFLCRLHGLPEQEARKRSLAWCERLQLNQWTHKKVEELSKGMQQKVQFIAALLHDPDLVIMDEPFAGLYPGNAVMLKDVLLELKKDGKTILFSTHRMDQVERLCDAICLIDHGRSILEGDLKQIKASCGKNHVQMQYEGDPQLDGNPLVESFNNYGNYVEVRLKPGADAQQLLRRAADHARITRFELLEPSLEEIFIDAVGKMHKVWLIVHREYLERVRSKRFLLFTLFLPAFMAGIFLIPSKLAEIKSGTARRIVIVAANVDLATAVKQELLAPLTVRYSTSSA